MTTTNPFTLTAMIVGTFLLAGSGVTIPTLWSQAATARLEADDASDKLQSARAEIVQLESQLNTARQQAADLGADAETRGAQATELRQSAEFLTEQLAELQNANRELKTDALRAGTLQRQLDSLQQQLRTAASEKAALQTKLDSALAAATKENERDGGPADRQVAARKPSELSTKVVQPPTARSVRYDDTGWHSVSRVLTTAPATTTLPGQVITSGTAPLSVSSPPTIVYPAWSF